MVPGPVAVCVAFLEQYYMKEEGLYLVTGSEESVKKYINKWDSRKSARINPRERPENIASTLVC
jgi:antitoxin component HigA of HigAB toxin-antitoxin module